VRVAKAAELAEEVWYGDGGVSRLARAMLRPGSLVFGAATRARNALYDRGWLGSEASTVPAVSVGNISVGGTGKTPVAAFVARLLRERGMTPALVTRGYGDDEPKVHRILNPDVPVIVSPDRAAGSRRARAEGADVVVYDDAFQHRRARRDVDLVLVSADRWRPNLSVLPAGPLREPPSSLRRATLLIVTRKAASSEEAERVRAWLASHAPGLPVATMRLAPSELVAWSSGERVPASSIAGRAVHAIAAIGDPRAFSRQLEALGATVTMRVFPDHHPFTAEDAAGLVAGLQEGALALCTLKDAVKLGPLWPTTASALWYLGQDVILERGEEALVRSLARVVTAADR
jgi:tetraacyldisaccharide 4'-kinase